MPKAAALEDRYHYRLIARALARIEGAGAALSLTELAREMGLSPAHFQRLFTEWAGISPKRYQQFLTLGQARALLAERQTLLQTALSTGLSGPARLHDLFLRWEAMRPGDYAKGGAGLRLRIGAAETPFGPAVFAASPLGLCGLSFADEGSIAAARADLEARWPAADFEEAGAAFQPLADQIFAPIDRLKGREGAGLPKLHLIGAPFHLKVWEALLRLPPGQVTSYGALAAALGQPKAARAVGQAVGHNPLAFLIPCHRVLQASGALGGYHWGLPRKRALLAYEQLRWGALAAE